MAVAEIKPTKKYEAEQLSACSERLAEQVSLAWEETRTLSVPTAFRRAENIAFVGMGGSSLGGHLIQGMCRDRLRAPLELVRDYTLPAYVNHKSVVLLSSFSGSTEEVLAVAKEAKARRAKIMIVTSGSKLAALARRERVPAYVFTPGELAEQPRLGLGFSMIGALGLLERAGLCKVTNKEIKSMVKAIGEVVDSSASDVSLPKNPAKQVALAIKGKAVLIVAAEHLVGNAHVFVNQINESGKQFAIYAEIPELNHHLMEGLTYPTGFFGKFSVLMLKSKLYHSRTQKRFGITADIFERQGGQVIEYTTGGHNRIDECGEFLQFGSIVSGYQSMVNKVDPYKIDFVREFKQKMGK